MFKRRTPSLLFFCISFFLCLSAAGKDSPLPKTTTYYHYDGQALSLNPSSFKRYIIPQARSMLAEYYSVLQRLHSGHTKLIEFNKHFSKLLETWEKTKTNCQPIHFKNLPPSSKKKFFEYCDNLYRTLHDQGKVFEHSILQLQTEKLKFASVNNQAELSSLIELANSLDDILSDNFKMLHYLESDLLISGNNTKIYQKTNKNISPLLHHMRLSSNGLVKIYLPDKNKQLFNFIWAKFFARINRYIIIQKDKNYLLRHLEELNIAWNTFNMKMSKGPQKYPHQIESLIQTMHNRWNSILKIILL